MNIHIFGYKYLYNGKNKRFFLGKEEFDIIKLYSDSNGSIDFYCDSYLKREKLPLFLKPLLYKSTEVFLKKLSKNLDSNVSILPLSITGEQNKYYPLCLNLELTNFCNFYCGHCYKEASNKERGFLNIEIVNTLINKYKGKIPLIHLTGGEPFSHPSINFILKSLFVNGFLVNITTNGSLWENVDETLLKKINNIQLSLYGCDEMTYYINSHFFGFSKVKSFIAFLSENNISFDLSLIFNKTYINNYEKYNSFINDIKYKNLIYGFADQAGRYTTDSIWHLNKKDKRMCYNFLRKGVFHYKERKGKKKSPCDAGTLSYSINEKGVLGLCQANLDKTFSLGNLNNLDERIKHNDFNIVRFCKNNKAKLSNLCRYKEEL